MQIKGTALKSFDRFIKKNFPSGYEQWVNSLPEQSRKYYEDIIMIADWYPLQEAILIPLRKAAEIFYNNDIQKAAFESGYFIAQEDLNTVYRLFIKVMSVDYVVQRASLVFASYYNGGEIEVLESNDKNLKIAIKGFKKEDNDWFFTFIGWIKALFDIIKKGKFEIHHKIEELNGEHIKLIVLIEFL